MSIFKNIFLILKNFLHRPTFILLILFLLFVFLFSSIRHPFFYLSALIAYEIAYQDYQKYEVFSPLLYLYFLLDFLCFSLSFHWWESILFTLPFLCWKGFSNHSIGGADIEYFGGLSLFYGGMRASQEILLAGILAIIISFFRQKKNGPIAMFPFFFFSHYFFILFL